jgi:SAM-dependent methyltransferase
MDLLEATGRSLSRRHPWETARADFFLRVLRDARLLRPDLAALDVGAGDAWFAARLAQASGAAVTCWDAAYAASPPPVGLPGSLVFVSAPPPSRFDLALLLDVLEHVEDDGAFLRSVVEERLRPGASVLVSVPAWPALFSSHDRALLHHRRYRPAAARALLARSGLRIERSGGLFLSLLLPRALQTLLDRLGVRATHAHAGEWRHGAAITSAIHALLSADGAIARLASRTPLELPGLSWWALCRRPS